MISGLCKKNHIPYRKINIDYERDTSYRNRFFSHNHGFNEKYFCAYCGKIITRKQVTVDHITPVAAAKNNVVIQKLLKLMGISNINNNKNLAPACKKCNFKKSSNTGFWLIRGYLGKHSSIWFINHIISFFILFFVVYTAQLQLVQII